MTELAMSTQFSLLALVQFQLSQKFILQFTLNLSNLCIKICFTTTVYFLGMIPQNFLA